MERPWDQPLRLMSKMVKSRDEAGIDLTRPLKPNLWRRSHWGLALTALKRGNYRGRLKLTN